MMTQRKSTRALATAAVLGIATLGPVALAIPADAAPGGNHGAKGNSGGAAKGNSGASKSNGSKSNGSRSNAGGSKGNSGNAGGSQGNAGGNSGNAGGSQGNAGGNSGNAGGSKSNAGAGSAKGGAAKGGSGKGGDPKGNNGTVKIETSAPDGTPNNVPHVGCTFYVEWYGFDQGATSNVTFAAQSPTRDAQIGVATDSPNPVNVGGDPASGAGTDTGLDKSATYTLSFSGDDPHPKQGYHVKLTINTTGSQGSDVKHKVFWVEPCDTTPPGGGGGTPPGGGGGTPPGGGGGTPPGGGGGTPPGGDTEVEGKQSSDVEVEGKQSSDVEVRGMQSTAPGVAGQVPTAVEAGLSTGIAMATSPLSVLITLLGMLVAAAGYASRRRKA